MDKKYQKGMMIGLFILAILVACSNKEQVNTPDVTVRLIEDINEMNLDSVPFVVNSFERRNVFLFDLLTNEKIAEFIAPEEDMQFFQPRRIGENYYGVFGLIGFDGSIHLYGDGTVNIDVIFYLLDEQLNLIEAVEITDSHLIINDYRAIILYEEERLTFLYPFWHHIYSYCPHTNETTVIADLQAHIPRDIQLMGEKQLAFWATIVDDEENIHYGLVDLETNEIQSFSQSNFRQSGFHVYGNYVVITENAPVGDQSQTIILDALTGETNLIELDGYRDAKLVYGGHFMLTKETDWLDSETHYVIRLYDVATQELMFEHEFVFDERNRRIDFSELLTIDEGIYALTILSSNQFQIETLEFETLFIIIEEVEE